MFSSFPAIADGGRKPPLIPLAPAPRMKRSTTNAQSFGRSPKLILAGLIQPHQEILLRGMDKPPPPPAPMPPAAQLGAGDVPDGKPVARLTCLVAAEAVLPGELPAR